MNLNNYEIFNKNNKKKTVYINQNISYELFQLKNNH